MDHRFPTGEEYCRDYKYPDWYVDALREEMIQTERERMSQLILRPNEDNPATTSNVSAQNNVPLASDDVLNNIRSMLTVPITSNTMSVSSMVSVSAGRINFEATGAAGNAGTSGWAGAYGVSGPTGVVGTSNSALDNSWVVYDGTGIVNYTNADCPVNGISYTLPNFHSCGVKEIIEMMSLACKCIKNGIPPQILDDIGEDLNTNNNPQSVIEQLKSFLREQNYGMDELEEDVMKDLQMSKNEV